MGNDTISNEGSIYRNLACFTDVLHTAGYYQVYMGGANSSFAGKGEFLAEHGYNEITGWEHWKDKERYRGDNTHSYWGLFDSDLIDEAISRTEELKERAPFNLTLLTLNTHLPGFYSKSCPADSERSGNEMVDAIRCSDAAIGRYLDWLDSNGFFENTVIVIVGDHKMFNHQNTRAILGDKMADRRIFGIIHSPDGKLPQTVNSASAPYDMAYTIPDLLGVSHNIDFSVGRSIVKNHEAGERFILDRDNQNNAINCNPANEVLPYGTTEFSPCEIRRIVDILDQNLSGFNSEDLNIIQSLDRVVMRSAVSDDAKPAIFLGDVEQLDHISREGVRKDISEPGLYCVILSSEGKVSFKDSFDVHAPSDMVKFLDLLENMKRGEWLFLTHKGNVMGDLPSSVHYMLAEMGLNLEVEKLKGHSCVFAGRKGADPGNSIFRYASFSEDIEEQFTFSDFKGMMPLIEHEKNRDLSANVRFLSMMLKDGKRISADIEEKIRICGFGGGESSFSFWGRPAQLGRGINFLIFSPLLKQIATLNYDFHESDAKIDELLKLLTGDYSKMDVTVAVAVHDDAKANLPESVISAFKGIGARKIDSLAFRAPYLLIFHTGYGIIYEAVGNSGECIEEDRRELIKKVLAVAEQQNDK